MAEVNTSIEITRTDLLEGGPTYMLKEEMLCWPGRAVGCTKPREWAVFHDRAEAELSFDYLASVYVGTCSEHLHLALQRHPTALNFIRPY